MDISTEKESVKYICCGLIFSLVSFLFSFVLGYMVVYDNELKANGSKN